ncbi:tRNA(fMet)-specific endonuclease VapC [Moraxella osloensis]|uniref:type II toxin-antitoxin system tRNA(fMet)-specific endonuclease VapC n=1 Tax=Faucicola osloensis TaxID=34062 RepID=UPI001093337C|nr:MULTISPECIES: tRNA(fMet)-specific endonuclease VapC [Pseudomonadota]TGP46713.1 tRNA(fMet)-specific endonuclease VapC [bacterium M00.F.Ca.ET.230.01.1.1]VWX30434.1 Ribonuclease VapC [Moraxellaceae bacterium 17A]MCK6158819.1 tRNA(fMet)-specific endonuclease VapC [Moraxella osloensis]QRO12523.1 tRNA(fMet)-specific endonuclease VapC [Moraxella osloensis]VXB28098.1 Ribonuclease VapC [Enhydrobacter sp. 8BJ]
MLTFMLDTNIAIHVIKQRPIAALNKFNQYAARICVSSITVAELYFGAENSQNMAKNLVQVDDFLSRLVILDYDSQAASHYGNIYADLTKKGNVISENDMHIAGHARSRGLILVTNNLREFERVEGLRLDNWVS